MVQQVRINDGTNTILQFPDGMSKQEMQDAIEKYYLPSRQNAPKNTIKNTTLSSQKPTLYQKYLEPSIDATKEGLERSGAGIGQLVYPLVDKALGTNLTNTMQQSRNSSAKAFNQKYKNDPYTRAMAKVIEIAPTFAGGAATDAAIAPKLVVNAIKDLPTAAKYAGSIGGIALKNAGLGALYGAANYDPTGKNSGLYGGLKKGLHNALPSALIGTATAGLVKTPQAIPKLFTKIAGNITPEELSKVNQILGNSKVGIGDVIESPGLKRFQENQLSAIPFSGVYKSRLKAGKKLINEGDVLLNKIRVPSLEDDVGSVILDSLKNNSKNAQLNSNKLYEMVNDIADNSGVNVLTKNHVKTAQNILDEIQKGKLTSALSKKDMNGLDQYLSTVLKSKTTSLKDANIAKGILKDNALEAGINSKKYLSAVYNKLSNSLKEDIGQSIEQSDNEELKDAYQAAENHYREKVAPFEDNDIAKFIRKKNPDSDTIINYFLRTGKNDRVKLLSKLMDKITPNEQKAMAHQYLKQAYQVKKGQSFPTLNPSKLLELYDKLGTKTQKRLLPEDFRKEMENYKIKVGKSTGVLNAMDNPPTGQKTKDLITAFALLHSPHVLIPALGGVNATNRIINSSKLRRLYLKGLLPINNPSKIKSGLAALAPMLY